MFKLDIRREGARLFWILDGRALVGMHWQVAGEAMVLLRQQIDSAARCAADPQATLIGETSCKFGSFELGFRCEQGRILFIGNGKLMIDPPVEVALKIWQGTCAQRALAEEHEKAEQVAKDNALLLRTGAPFGLSDNPAILAESVKIARDDRDLRRFLPGGIRATALLGTPVVKHGDSGERPIDEVMRLLPALGLSGRRDILQRVSQGKA